MDFLFISRINKWFLKNKQNVNPWIDAIGQIEAYSSIAMYSCSKNKDFIFPEISDEKFKIECDDLGHPLLYEKSEVVTNKVCISSNNNIIFITGSNMSGKSTFMRSIGSNLILAKIGARVFAKSFNYYPHVLFTSFEIKDNISTGKSTFFAEVLRLKSLIKLIEQNAEPFFLIDELLRGTNSKDRIKGSLELIRKLKKNHCFGYITSHDLTLPEMLTIELKESFFYFSSTIVNGDLYFDYKIRKGICPETNGYFIMKKEDII